MYLSSNDSSHPIPKYLIFILLALSSSASFSKNSFLVAPGRVDFDLKKPSTQSFIITNNGDNKIRLVINPTYFPIDSKSMAAGTHLKPETANIEDLTKYVRVAPRTLSLAPGQRRDIRISLRPPSTLTEGDYRTHLLVSMKEASQVIGSAREGEDTVGMKLNIKMETAVAIYGHKGERNPELNFLCAIDQQTNKLKLDITNQSLWRFDGFVRIYDPKKPDNKIDENRLVSLRESKKSLITNFIPASKNPILIRWFDFDTDKEAGSKTCNIQ